MNLLKFVSTATLLSLLVLTVSAFYAAYQANQARSLAERRYLERRAGSLRDAT